MCIYVYGGIQLALQYTMISISARNMEQLPKIALEIATALCKRALGIPVLVFILAQHIFYSSPPNIFQLGVTFNAVSGG